jgi:hypothetical protein
MTVKLSADFGRQLFRFLQRFKIPVYTVVRIIQNLIFPFDALVLFFGSPQGVFKFANLQLYSL